jgi:1,2-phenylacetyl-CoA epoxidase catalytic subunit
MLHLLLEDDWSEVSDHTGEDLVEETLSMRTGSHILGAFNIDFDSFVDNVTFCCLIDRVGKYQLAMQRMQENIDELQQKITASSKPQ